MATVAIVGRPNVGKSTLFNRLIQGRKAIVDDLSGVTRDRHYGISDWTGKSFSVVDTGGFVPRSDDVFEKAIREQVQIALNEASAVIFMVDVTTGVTDLDEEMALLLRKSDKPVLVAVNKVDNAQRAYDAAEFYALGLDNYHNISSINGSGTGELLDQLVEMLPDEEPKEEEEDIPKIAVIGQPNVGKSSLVNALLGEDRNIVTDVAGTTRDSIHTRYTMFNKNLILLDTAGLRKKAKVHENLEFYSVLRAIRAIEEADVCIMLFDASEGMEGQDVNVFRLALRRKRGLVIVGNKWDLVEKDTNSAEKAKEKVLERLAPFTDVPVIFTSALDKTRVLKTLESAMEVYDRKKSRISTSKLNDVMLQVIEASPPPMHRGHAIKIKHVHQLPSVTPSFAFYCNYPDHIKEPYKNFIENRLRENFDLTGVPINVFFRKK